MPGPSMVIVASTEPPRSSKTSIICLRQGGSRVDHVVGQDDGERLVADQLLGAEHRMAQAERLLLAHVADARHRRDAARDLQQLLLAAALERGVQLEADVEVVFHRALAAPGHDDDVLDAGGDALLPRRTG